MSVYFEKGRGHRFDFWYQKTRHRSPRGFPTEREAKAAEKARRDSLRLHAAGLQPDPDPVAPRFSEWAGVYVTWLRERAALGLIKRPEIIEGNVRVVLRFWGARPAPAPDEPVIEYATPYHDLRLDDPLTQPQWLRDFETWLQDRKVSKSTRNHYLNTLSQMYHLALDPEYRQDAPGIDRNPFSHRPRTRWRRRTVIVTPPQLEAWIRHASYHARLAMAIATLAPKLRLGNILALDWAQVDLDRNVIEIEHHKTDASGEPLVAPISSQLREILLDARHRHPRQPHVVVYRGVAVKTIDGAIKAAAQAAGLTYGRDVRGGVTFHSLRHSMSTLFARLKVHPLQHQAAMGHGDFSTTLGYTHLEADDQREPHEQLAAAVPILEAVTTGPTRARRRVRGELLGAGGAAGGLSSPKGSNILQKPPVRAKAGRPFHRKEDGRKSKAG